MSVVQKSRVLVLYLVGFYCRTVSVGPGPSVSRGRLQLSCAPAGGSAVGLLSMVLKIQPDLSEVLNRLRAAGLVCRRRHTASDPLLSPGGGLWPSSSCCLTVLFGAGAV